LIALAALLLMGEGQVEGQSLGGSEASVNRTHRQAENHDFTFLTTSSQVRRFADAGYLIRVRPNRDFTLNDVSFPYARPEVATFIQRLGAQYRRACGEQLVVTSLTRPTSRQPRNASVLSVHPTGMAVDLRRSRSSTCRRWLESTLLYLEEAGVLEATRERTPSHYHVAVFPRQYGEYVARLASNARSGGEVLGASRYMVRNGDSLWTIAERHGTTVSGLRAANGISGSRIFAGQVLTVPSR
jgi:nucleoid-associated protein YgaU